MRQFAYSLLIFLFFGFITTILPLASAARGQGDFQDTPVVDIRWPLPGQAILGNIAISGNTAIEGFRSSELLFGYANDNTDTWFLIAQSDSPINNDVLADWDTTVITDGNYNIILSVNLENGEKVAASVKGVRVRNYSPIETNTPSPITPTATQVPGDTPLPTITPTSTITPIPPTATFLPTNPVVLTTSDLFTGFGKGIVAAVGFFLLLGGYLGIRAVIKHRA